MSKKNKQQSENRKINKSFKEQVDQQKAKTKKALEDMPKWKKVAGMMLLPLMLIVWVTDRAIHIMLPHATHPGFKQFLMNEQSFKYTLARVIIFGIPVLIYNLIF